MNEWFQVLGHECEWGSQPHGTPATFFYVSYSSHTLCTAARSGSAAPAQTGSSAQWQHGSLHRAASEDSHLLEQRKEEGKGK